MGWCWSVVYRVVCFGVTGVRRGLGRGKARIGGWSVEGEGMAGKWVVLSIYLTCIVLSIGYRYSHQKVAACAATAMQSSRCLRSVDASIPHLLLGLSGRSRVRPK